MVVKAESSNGLFWFLVISEVLGGWCCTPFFFCTEANKQVSFGFQFPSIKSRSCLTIPQ
jgi:hypothetical protein